MKMSLLSMVQNILSSMDSDEVNSISDTTESRQVAEIIKTAYFNILARANLPEHNQLFSLTPSNEIDQPVLMYRPDNVASIKWIKYDIATQDHPEVNYAYVTILPIEQFLDISQRLNPADSDVGMLSLNDYTFYYKNNTHPCYCTVVQDYIVVFNSFDNIVDGTLQESKTLCYGRTIPAFSMVDAFIPDLDDQQFPLLLNEAKSLAFFELKQMAHEASALESRRQWRSLQKNKFTVKPNYFDELPNFGRRYGRKS